MSELKISPTHQEFLESIAALAGRLIYPRRFPQVTDTQIVTKYTYGKNPKIIEDEIRNRLERQFMDIHYALKQISESKEEASAFLDELAILITLGKKAAIRVQD